MGLSEQSGGYILSEAKEVHVCTLLASQCGLHYYKKHGCAHSQTDSVPCIAPGHSASETTSTCGFWKPQNRALNKHFLYKTHSLGYFVIVVENEFKITEGATLVSRREMSTLL